MTIAEMEQDLKIRLLMELELSVKDEKPQDELEKLEFKCMNFGATVDEVIEAIHKGKGWK